jgi:hypothetical protein
VVYGKCITILYVYNVTVDQETETKVIIEQYKYITVNLIIMFPSHWLMFVSFSC